jgi:hypothetical protein
MYNGKINKRALVAAALGIILLATTVVSIGTTEENVFAYKKNQAASLANSCGNGDEPFNVLCQNLLSQIQGDGNAVNIIGLQTGGERTTPPPPPPPEPEPEPQTCEECFTSFLSLDEQAEFLRVMDESFDQFTPDTTLEDICILTTQAFQIDNFIAGVLGAGVPEGGIPGNDLVPGMNLDQDRIDEIVECLHRVLGF